MTRLLSARDAREFPPGLSCCRMSPFDICPLCGGCEQCCGCHNDYREMVEGEEDEP